MTGQLIAGLIDGPMPAGQGYKELPAHQLPSGTYFVRLQSDDQVKTEQFIVLD
jgi:hypothetical protein